MKAKEDDFNGSRNYYKYAFFLILLFLVLSAFLIPYKVKKIIHSTPNTAIGGVDATTDSMIENELIDSIIELNKPTEREKLETEVKDWLNTKKEIKELQLECISVSLIKENTNKYTGFAQFFNGEKTGVEVTLDNNNYLFNAKMPKGNIVPRIKNSTLPDYEYTTIGKAFNSFFDNPNWEYKETPNGSKYVEFTGKLKEDISLSLPEDELQLGLAVAYGVTPWKLKTGDLITIKFAVSHDVSSFDLWSMKINEEEMRYNDYQSMKHIKEILNHIYAID